MASTTIKPVNPAELILTGLGTAALLTDSFPPWNVPLTIWFALAGLLTVIPRLSWRGVEWLGFLTGAAFYGFNFRWFHAIFGFPAVALWAILALFFAVFCALVRTLPPDMPAWRRILLIACFWVAVEFVRCEQWPLKFSWLALGYGPRQALVLPVAGVIGVYGLSFLAAATSAWASIKCSEGCIALILFASLLVVAAREPSRSSPHMPMTAMAVQSASPSVAVQKRLSGAEFTKGHTPALVAWPEYTVQQTPEEAPDVYAGLERWAKYRKTTLVFGGLTSRGGEKFSSAAYVIGPNGQQLGVYEKHDPLPFFQDGEPGGDYPVFPLKANGHSLPFGVTICFDLSFERNARRLVENGARFLVVPSEEPPEWPRLEQMQHALIAPMRAAENGVGILRVSAPGPSQVVNADGTIWRELPVGREGVLFASPPAPLPERTIYNRVGWLFPWLCQGVTVLWLLALVRRRLYSRTEADCVHGTP